MIGTMVGDVLAETERRVHEAGVETIDDVRAAGGPLAGFSGELAAEERELKRFLYDRLYGLPQLDPFARKSQRVVAELAAAYRADPALLPPDWQRGGDPVEQLRTIGDFIAGMTDRFAIARHEELVGPVNLPSGRFWRRSQDIQPRGRRSFERKRNADARTRDRSQPFRTRRQAWRTSRRPIPRPG